MMFLIDNSKLIDLAKKRSGLKLYEMASEMRTDPNRISEWKNERTKPSAEQIAYLAMKAGLPVLETLATLRPEWSELWRSVAASTTQRESQDTVAFPPTAQPTDTRPAPKPIKTHKRATSASANA